VGSRACHFERLSYSELFRSLDQVAAGLHDLGIRPGNHVGLVAENCDLWLLFDLAILSLGAADIPRGGDASAAEIEFCLSHARANAAVVEKAAHVEKLGALRDRLQLIVVMKGEAPPGTVGLAEVMERGRGRLAEDDELIARHVAAIGPDTLATIIYTSGTTGNPKGVVMTHGQTLRAYLDWCDFADLREGDRYLIANPFFHIFGYKAGCLASLLRGATIIPVAVFDAGVVLELVERERVSVLPGPPTIYHSLLDHPDRTSRDISSLRVAVTGAADIPVQLIRRVRAELPFERILTGYGLTEAGTVTGSKPDDDFEHIATTVGVPWPGFEVRTVTEAGADTPAGEPGEVVVRGETVMRGYLDDPDATAAAIDAEGWLHTGDLGTFDADGYLRIVGRIKDMFIVGGFNAYPAEIEGFLLEHPAVAQAAVIGVPDVRLGQVGKAFIVTRSSVSEEQLIAWSRERMAGYKVPRSVESRTELPLNGTGKVMKDQLMKEQVMQDELAKDQTR
jgi:acyl-CoA synthetase (AMP-forming)/AMP-acid ligase II